MLMHGLFVYFVNTTQEKQIRTPVFEKNEKLQFLKYSH